MIYVLIAHNQVIGLADGNVSCVLLCVAHVGADMTTEKMLRMLVSASGQHVHHGLHQHQDLAVSVCEYLSSFETMFIF